MDSSQHGHLCLQGQQVDLSFQSVQVESYNIMKLWKWHSITFAIVYLLEESHRYWPHWRSGESQRHDWWWGLCDSSGFNLGCVYLRSDNRHIWSCFLSSYLGHNIRQEWSQQQQSWGIDTKEMNHTSIFFCRFLDHGRWRVNNACGNRWSKGRCKACFVWVA